jgi:prepilin-type N-terminal cleavage/methylation domain-containing protein
MTQVFSRPAGGGAAGSRLAAANSAFARRPGFTLIELMVVCAIIGILASTILFALFGAQESAREAKTKTLITKLNNVVMPKYEAYRTRRVPVALTSSLTRAQSAQDRLDALHDLMRLELPDQWMDVWTSPMTLTNSGMSVPVPATTLAYQTAFNNATGQSLTMSSSPSAATLAPYINYQAAECLYLIATLNQTDTLGGRDLFNENNIGDYDGDGLKEFKDAWGMPIRFLRWPAGFVSDLQPIPPSSQSDPTYLSDPFDPFHVYPASLTGVSPTQTGPTFALYPLIYSAGGDKTYGLYTTIGGNSTVANHCYPFMVASDGTSIGGQPSTGDCTTTDDANTQPSIAPYGWKDNIHNQLMGTR